MKRLLCCLFILCAVLCGCTEGGLNISSADKQALELNVEYYKSLGYEEDCREEARVKMVYSQNASFAEVGTFSIGKYENKIALSQQEGTFDKDFKFAAYRYEDKDACRQQALVYLKDHFDDVLDCYLLYDNENSAWMTVAFHGQAEVWTDATDTVRNRTSFYTEWPGGVIFSADTGEVIATLYVE